MKFGVHLEGAGQLEANSHWINDPGDGEWADELGSQLTRLHPQGELLSAEPNLVAHLVTWLGGPAFIGLPNIGGRVLEESPPWLSSRCIGTLWLLSELTVPGPLSLGQRTEEVGNQTT